MKNKQKQMAAEASIEFIKDGMTVGLGSGSTINFMLEQLAERVKEGLKINGIPSSLKTERYAKRLGIPLSDFSTTTKIDIAIDGADEVDPNLHLLKGGGGSLVREKIVDRAADKLIIIVDSSKVVSKLGEFPLPVEVLPFGFEVTTEQISAAGCVAVLREKDGQPFVSDNGNYILDCKFDSIEDPQALHEKLKSITGVVETGLFPQMAHKVIVAREGTVDILQR
ncbi:MULTISPECIES: ribose-5-phosphate isomerase RpiA [unclassified Oceanobacillus]|uniref:ribose-5-phosphate isomerase RpiA n=1 Tax=unclassified Oceanobacillus TaxID=2630292 RepID=UPI0012EB9AAE|nr:ribose-5-phosphate isomerase RpiA [Oceanobacillus sp. AG]